MVDFIYHVWLAILIFGIMSNFINISVFLILGDRDNVSTSLLVLSASDLGYLAIRSFSTVARLLVYHYPDFLWTFDPKLFLVCIYWYGQVFYDFSCFISVFLATLRCCCVVLPLKFKAVFTRSRTVKTLTFLFIAAIFFRGPQLFAHGPMWKVDPVTNRTLLSCYDTKEIKILTQVNDIVNRNIISSVAYITVSICVVTMIVKLRTASRFRNTMTQHAVPAKSTSMPSKGEQTNKNQEHTKSKNSEKMSAKEIHLIQSIILLSIIFLMSQLPFQIYSTIRLFLPDFDSDRSQLFLFGIASHISTTFSFLNCSVNIFVYLTYNRKFKDTMLLFLCPKKVLSKGDASS